jgi:tRNA nucleotidyltransferase (CCA-adding enzyme)
MFERLEELDLLKAIHPGLTWDTTIKNRMSILSEVDPPSHWHDFLELSGKQLRRSLAYILWIIHQPIDIVKAVIYRLRYPRSQIEVILAAVSLSKEATSLKGKLPSEIVANLDGIPPLAIYANYLIQTDDEIINILGQYALKWRLVSPSIDGHDLRDKGIPPGPVYRDILKSLRNAWLDSGITSRQQEIDLLNSLISKYVNEDIKQ